ncbi:MAG: ribosomal-protein-serine acetyltransferase [Oceanicoccus sp.]|jgi:ribosomal-protein-serine acetyltransferase
MDYRVNQDIVIEQLKLAHAQELYDLTEANRENLREWLPWLDQIESISDTKKFIESTTNNLDTHSKLDKKYFNF